jgi:4-amino-4-deoxy-L-arabinose transferase-like glycosyltransferase
LETLSNTNDFVESWFGFIPVVLAGILLIVIIRKRVWHRLSDLQFPTRYYYSSIGLFVIFLSVVFFTLTPKYPWGGGDKYFFRALNIIVNGVFGYGDQPTALFPPGYSFMLVPFIAFFGVSPAAYFLANVFLLIGSSIVFRGILLKLGLKPDLANFFATIIILYPNRFLSTLLPFSDIAFSLISMIAFGFFLLYSRTPEKILYLILAALCTGIAALTRSNGVFLFLSIVLGILLQVKIRFHTRVVRTIVFILVFSTVLGPWTIRNYSLFHKFVLVSTNGGLNLALGNNPSNPLVKNASLDSACTAGPVWAALRKEKWNEAQQDSFLATQGVRYIREHPSVFFIQGWKKMFRAFLADAYSFGYLGTYTNIHTLFSPVQSNNKQTLAVTVYHWIFCRVYQFLYIINNVVYYLLLPFSLFCVFLLKKEDRHIKWFFIATIFYVCICIFLVLGISRYKEPIGTIQLFAIVLFYLHEKRGPGSIPAGQNEKTEEKNADVS